ncbi:MULTISPECIES: aminotransferase class V-fold PLP-dependent enzyme [unclassified Nocardia]|uniref:aminotransferase class V-fold PLP-dependent enzyme n=1 Tax=unclassified Nocardia TaxID=2637762 RepID=UPI00278BFC8D|nr:MULTISPECIES: aminotransferase class V-fold PLP-dependent enzyme [unclassified Nocardia]
MKAARREEFPLAPDIVHLNHASYGLVSRKVLNAAEKLRYNIESDPTQHLGTDLMDRLRTRTTQAAETLELAADQLTLCSNATSAAAAIITSLPLTAADTVVVLDTEYSAIHRAWEVACSRSGARFLPVPVPLPFDDPDLLRARLDACVPGSVSYLQTSLISSSAAIRLPVRDLSAWAQERSGQLIVDAAHGPGHTDLTADGWGASAVFGTLHKWFPAARSVGFLWLAPQLVDVVRPAEVSLTWDSPDLVERFSWPGTFDPAPRLSLGAALQQWRRWYAAGYLTECEKLADYASEVLPNRRVRPTAGREYRPPRMRSFILDNVTVTEVKSVLTRSGIRAWVGPGPNGECLLRIATHIYNDTTDIDLLADTIQEVLPR